MSNNLILSITIPTWNRARSLENALEHLLPQVIPYKESVEIVISDNGSTDNTKEIINAFTSRYAELSFNVFHQKENTGFYGNFRKCKELAQGEFIWLLSDDDYVQDGTIKSIVDYLADQRNTGFIFLESVWNKEKCELSFSEEMPLNDLLVSQHYRLTLISVVIFKNTPVDESFMEHFKGSDFLGYAMFLYCIRQSEKAVVLSGRTLEGNNQKHRGFNWFKAFCVDLPGVVTYMKQHGYSKEMEMDFKNQILTDLIRPNYLLMKINGKLEGDYEYWPMGRIRRTIVRNFHSTSAFVKSMLPVFILPAPLIKAIKNKRHTLNGEG